jgi:hypothetical protein
MRNRTGKVSSVLGLAGAAAVGFWLGRGGPQPAAAAAPPAEAPAQAPASDYAQRVVAYVHGTIPITREDLGEYLIARQGVDKVEMLVNRKIIDLACRKRGVEVTDAEVNADLEETCRTLTVDRADFVNKVLKQYGKTLYEWKEDVVRPKLLMTKLCIADGRVAVTEDDLRQAFEAAHGRKVECRIIIWPKGEEKIALNAYDKLRKSEEEFDRAARTQANPHLAAVGGRVRPIARHAGAHADVEKEAFALQPGEVSRLIVTPEGTVVLKCDKQLPADEAVKFEDRKEALHKEVFDRKVQAEIPALFKALKEEANPKFFLKKATTAEELKAEVEREVLPAGGPVPKQ